MENNTEQGNKTDWGAFSTFVGFCIGVPAIIVGLLKVADHYERKERLEVQAPISTRTGRQRRTDPIVLDYRLLDLGNDQYPDIAIKDKFGDWYFRCGKPDGTFGDWYKPSDQERKTLETKLK